MLSTLEKNSRNSGLDLTMFCFRYLKKINVQELIICKTALYRNETNTERITLLADSRGTISKCVALNSVHTHRKTLPWTDRLYKVRTKPQKPSGLLFVSLCLITLLYFNKHIKIQ